MNSFERMEAAIHFQETDRTPVWFDIIQHTLNIANIPYDIYAKDPVKMLECQMISLDMYDYDGIFISSDNKIIAEAMGDEVIFPHDDLPRFGNKLLYSSDDLSCLKRVDPQTSGRMPVMLEATRLAREHLKNSRYIKTCLDGAPFTAAAVVRGEERFMFDLYENESFVFDLLELCAEAVISFGTAAAKSGAHALTYGDSVVSLISRDLYLKYAHPFEKHVIDGLKKTGIPVFLHVCGDPSHIFDLLVECGPDVLEIDSSLDLGFAKKIAGTKVALEGNVDPVGILLNGTPEQAYAESIKCMELAGSPSGFILSAGCEVPRNTAAENIKAMVRAARDYLPGPSLPPAAY